MIGMWRRSGAHEVESVSRTARFVMHAIVNCIVMKFATIYETSPRDPLSNPSKSVAFCMQEGELSFCCVLNNFGFAFLL